MQILRFKAGKTKNEECRQYKKDYPHPVGGVLAELGGSM
jgi:hypothetical protein